MIRFFSEDTQFLLEKDDIYQKWISKVIHQFSDFEVGDINYIFCSDSYLLEINQEYLDHNDYTDIITFPLDTEPLTADIFISIDRVKENAIKYSTKFNSEIKRVMAHGVLHIIGYNDKEEEDKRIMRLKENEAISLF